MKGKGYHTVILAGMALLVVGVAASIVLHSYTARRVSYLDRFFTEVSEEYRAIKGSSGERFTGGGGGGGDGGDDSRVCVSVDIDLDSDPVLGDPNAPVVIVEYSDFECPFCAQYFTGAYQQIKEQYIDTGVARLYYKDFPLENIHPLARPAAIVANCIYEEQGDAAFYAFHDTLFGLQGRLISVDNITRLAVASGMSPATIDACMNDPAYDDEITMDMNEGQSIGVNGTPSFVINGELVIGAQPFSEFERAIGDAIAGDGCQG